MQIGGTVLNQCCKSTLEIPLGLRIFAEAIHVAFVYLIRHSHSPYYDQQQCIRTSICMFMYCLCLSHAKCIIPHLHRIGQSGRLPNKTPPIQPLAIGLVGYSNASSEDSSVEVSPQQGSKCDQMVVTGLCICFGSATHWTGSTIDSTLNGALRRGSLDNATCSPFQDISPGTYTSIPLRIFSRGSLHPLFIP